MCSSHRGQPALPWQGHCGTCKRAGTSGRILPWRARCRSTGVPTERLGVKSGLLCHPSRVLAVLRLAAVEARLPRLTDPKLFAKADRSCGDILPLLSHWPVDDVDQPRGVMKPLFRVSLRRGGGPFQERVNGSPVKWCSSHRMPVKSGSRSRSTASFGFSPGEGRFGIRFVRERRVRILAERACPGNAAGKEGEEEEAG